MTAGATPVHLERSTATASVFHARSVPEPADWEIWWHDVSAPALVLGSTQSDAVVDEAACVAAGVEIVRRRSGGGVVLLLPGEVTWVDVIVPAGSVAWSDDVHEPMRWLGRHLAAAVADVLADPHPSRRLGVHVGALQATPWSRLVCFDGLGPGEVLLDGVKLVGISQRRTRAAARLQCAWYSSYDPAALVELLHVEHRPPPGALAPVATLPRPLAERVPFALARRLTAAVTVR